ncbi:MAG: hypothetical protein K6F52_04475 [Clostridia bacterium]|nr:hypothetical protein [Clostridia bacterium]
MRSDMNFMNNFTKNIIIALGSIIMLSALIAINLDVLSIISIIVLVLISGGLKENTERRMSYGTTRNLCIPSELR